MGGFCERCNYMLPSHEDTAHATIEDCLETVKAGRDLAMQWAEREHKWVHRLEDKISELQSALRQIEEVAGDGHLPPMGYYGLPLDWRPFNDRHDKVQAWVADRARLARGEELR